MNRLITKYRPKTFDGVVGQEAAVRQLRAVVAKRTASTFMFIGPHGVGKTTLARITATAMGAEGQDIREIDAASNSGVDDMRELTSKLAYSSLTGGSRAYIIDEAHMLSKAAWNSLLKSIEEPPPGVFFMFCTTEASKIPKTSGSRCCRVNLKPVAIDAVGKLLRKIVAKAKLGTDPEIISFIAKKCRGSVRDALSCLAQCYGTSSRQEVADVLQTIADSSGVAPFAPKLLYGRLTWPQAMGLLDGMEDVDAESVRMGVVGFIAKVLKGAKSDRVARRGLDILQAFSEPYPPGSRLYPIQLSLGQVIYG